MANIYSVQDGNSYHWTDPNAWDGGVVPGKLDTAYIRHKFTRINSGSGYPYWTGTRDRMRVDSTSELPSAGSIYTYLTPSGEIIKIDYTSKDGSYINNCTIDHSYQEWQPGVTGSSVGMVRNDTVVFTQPTTIYLSGSADVSVNQVVVEDAGKFIIKDQATIRLDTTQGDARIFVRDGVLHMLDECTAIISGSSERGSTTTIYHQSYDFSQVLVSGSSDLRTRTRISSDIRSGSAILPVASAANFEAGDLISIYDEEATEIQGTLGPNDLYDPYNYKDTGSMFPISKRLKVRDQDETVQVVGKTGNNLTVRKFNGREGEIIGASTASVSPVEFTRRYGTGNGDFTGSKTSITVRSRHNSFVPGDSIVIGNSTYKVLAAGDKLIPYKFIDFSAGANLDDFLVDTQIGSGSSDAYKANSHFKTGSKLELDRDVIGYNEYYRSLHLKNTKLRDVKVTLSGSQIYNGSHHGGRMLGVAVNDCPYLRTRVTPFYNRPGNARAPFNGVYSSNQYQGNMEGNSQYIDTRTYSDFDTTPCTTHAVTVGIDALREDVTYTYNGFETGKAMLVRPAGTVSIHIRREGTSIHSLRVEEYVQELILDTTDSFEGGTKVYEGGTLVDHSTNQRIVKLASKVTNLRGYTDLAAQYALGNEDASIIPMYWSNSGNKTYHQNSATTSDRSRTDAMFKHSIYRHYWRMNSSGTTYSEINLGAEITLDAIGITDYYAYQGQYVKNFGIEVSTDGRTWQEVRARADEPRLGTQAGTHRIYKFNEVRAKFIRLNLGGTSATSNNYLSKISIYHFNGRGDTLELSNTSDINVGDEITIVSPHGRANNEYGYSREHVWRSNLRNGSKTEADYVGGPRDIYTVTAKSGNVITLDRTYEGDYLHPESYVYKLNRAITIKGANYLPAGFYYADDSAHIGKVELYNFSALYLGNATAEQGYFRRYPRGSFITIQNASIYYMEPDNFYTRGATVLMNNIFLNSTMGDLYNGANNSTAVVHGNLVQGHSCARLRLTADYYVYNTGNFYDSFRYGYMHNTYGDQPAPGYTVIRGNYIAYNDYMNIDWTHYHGKSGTNLVMHDNVYRQTAGYIRPYPGGMTLWTVGNRVEWPKPYPATLPHAYPWRTNMNLPVYITVGNDHIEKLPVFDHPNLSGRPYFVDDGRNMVIKDKHLPQFDMYAIHQNRTGAAFLSCNFQTPIKQPVKVRFELDYTTPQALDDYNYSSEPGRDWQVILVGPDGRRIAGRTLPYQRTFSTEVFEHSFTAEPGQYGFYLIKRHGGYNFKVMTYRNSKFSVFADDPESIYVSVNNFADHKVLMDRKRYLGAKIHTFDKKAGDNNDQRTGMKVRKIKF